MFLVYIADLKALGSLNTSIKFAGEYTFTVPAVSDVSVELEMINIKKWSDDKLCLNLDKTKEIIFHGPHPSKLCVTPPTLCDVERVSSAKLLGIYFIDKMSMSEHIQHTVSVFNQR